MTFQSDQLESFIVTLNDYLGKGYLVVHTIPAKEATIVILEKPD